MRVLSKVELVVKRNKLWCLDPGRRWITMEMIHKLKELNLPLEPGYC